MGHPITYAAKRGQVSISRDAWARGPKAEPGFDQRRATLASFRTYIIRNKTNLGFGHPCQRDQFENFTFSEFQTIERRLARSPPSKVDGCYRSYKVRQRRGGAAG